MAKGSLNPQKELDRRLVNEEERGKKVCLHSCCAPCSSYCLLYLSRIYEITVYYYNPNISSEAEYRKRAEEQKRLIGELNRYAELAAENPAGAQKLFATLWEQSPEAEGMQNKHPELWEWIRESLFCERFPISYVEGEFDTERFYQMAAGLETEPERGRRCHGCYGLRLSKAAEYAEQAGSFSYVATTLTLSPLKDAQAINRIGLDICGKKEVTYLETDFKKKNGYLISILLSELFHLYRQNFCGCRFSADVAE